MRIRKYFAVETLVEPRFIKNSCLEIFGVRRYVGLPTDTGNHGQVRSRLPRILDIRAYVAFAGVPPDERLLLELKDKLDVTVIKTAVAGGGYTGDILNALLALGYNDKEAAWAVKQLPGGAAVAEGIRQALKLLSKQ